MMCEGNKAIKNHSKEWLVKLEFKGKTQEKYSINLLFLLMEH